jgi:hypothetical protein
VKVVRSTTTSTPSSKKGGASQDVVEEFQWNSSAARTLYYAFLGSTCVTSRGTTRQCGWQNAKGSRQHKHKSTRVHQNITLMNTTNISSKISVILHLWLLNFHCSNSVFHGSCVTVKMGARKFNMPAIIEW